MAASAAVALAVPAAGQTGGTGDTKPTLKLQSCVFVGTKKVPFLAEGLRPGVAFALKLGGRTLRSGRVRADGTVGSSIRAPRLGTRGQRLLTLSVETKAAKVSRRFTTTLFAARISPRVTGHSPRDRFRFRLYGFLRGGTIYAHWVRPNGVGRWTERLGRPHGACGSLVSRRIALFPFPGRLARGNWRLQFDKKLRYSKRTKPPRARLKIPIL